MAIYNLKIYTENVEIYQPINCDDYNIIIKGFNSYS